MKFLLLVLAIHFVVEVIVKKIKTKESNRCRKEGYRRPP